MRHQLTREERQKGGWTRARQKALERTLNPSPLEEVARRIALLWAEKNEYTLFLEYEIDTGNFPQFIDILLSKDGQKTIAAEVDGSHGWHGLQGKTKMRVYDQAKKDFFDKNKDKYIFLWVKSKEVDSLERILNDTATITN